MNISLAASNITINNEYVKLSVVFAPLVASYSAIMSSAAFDAITITDAWMFPFLKGKEL